MYCPTCGLYFGEIPSELVSTDKESGPILIVCDSCAVEYSGRMIHAVYGLHGQDLFSDPTYHS